MITGKNVKRVALISLALILSLCSIACNKQDKDDKYDGIFSPEEPSWNAEHEYATYAVVVASEATFAVYDAAKDIAQKLAENTGAYAECFYAHEEIPKGSDVCRILVGDVGIEQSGKYLKNFRADDIGYKYHDKRVYIGGITEASLLRAIEKFTDDVVVYTDKEFFMNEDTEYFLGGEYDIEQIKMLGFSLGEYTLVYPNGDDKLREIANDFSSKILKSSGYLISVCSDSELDSESRAILLGDCDAFEEYRIEAQIDGARIVGFELGVMIVADQPLAVRAALDELEARLLTADEGGCVELMIDKPIDIAFDTVDVSILSFRPNSYELSFSDMTSMIEIVRASYPDIIRFERVSRASMESLLYNFNDRYELITISNDTHHMIRKDRYSYDEIETVGDVNTLKYAHVDLSTKFNVLELGDAPDETKTSCSSILATGEACLVFSDAALSGIDGIKSVSALFGESKIGRIDTPYFAGDALAPTLYSVTETIGFNYSYTQIKISSFN